MIRIRIGLAIAVGAMLSLSGVAFGQSARSGTIVSGTRMAVQPQLLKSAAKGDVADASNDFAFDLYRRLASVNGGKYNLVFSPCSLSSALTMARLGARGATADAMSDVLHLPPTGTSAETGWKSLGSAIAGDAGKTGLDWTQANALWLQKGEPILADYADEVKQCFGAEATPIDFAAQPEACRTQINDWTAHLTHDKIKALLPPGSITALTRLVLENAVVFQGKWATAFDPAKTRKLNFTVFGKKAEPVDMMQTTEIFGFAQDHDCRAVLLPYAGGKFAMLVLVPHVVYAAETAPGRDPSRAALEKLEADLSARYIQQLMDAMTHRPVNVGLPRWRSGQWRDLSDMLQQMGMKQAFSADADFSGISGRQGWYISDVIHSATVEVDEHGAKAAAASAVVAPGGVEEPAVDCFADHPFVYLIVHVPSRAVLFAGRMVDPTAEK